MFLENKYTKLYHKLTSSPDFDDYTENHHIIPKSLGGSDDPSNLVRLSARKHFLCHYLLTKMFPKNTFSWYKMNHAFMYMKCSSFCNTRYFNSRLYEALRGNFSAASSFNQSGIKNSQFGTTWIYCPYTLVSRRVPKVDLKKYLERGCVRGCIYDTKKFIERNKINHNLYIFKTKNKNKTPKQVKRSDRLKLQHEKIYTDFINSGLSMNKFKDITGCSIGTLHNIIKKFRPPVSNLKG